MLSADVYFWVDGGWDQPNCGVVVDPLVLRSSVVPAQNCIVSSNWEFFTQQRSKRESLMGRQSPFFPPTCDVATEAK
jgi:hypothetical protein